MHQKFEVDTAPTESDGNLPPCAAAGGGSNMLRLLRRFVIFLMGGSVLLVGIAMIVLPGPAVVVIPAGLAILATEFLWARRILRRMKEIIDRGRQRAASKAAAGQAFLPDNAVATVETGGNQVPTSM